MKKVFKLHYILIDGYEPQNPDRDYICYSVMSPHSGKMRTLCVDSNVLNSIMKKCKDDDLKSSLWEAIQQKFIDKIDHGFYKGYVLITI